MEHKEFTARIFNLAQGGTFIGVIEDSGDLNGKKAFIPFVAPGEVVRARVTREKSS